MTNLFRHYVLIVISGVILTCMRPIAAVCPVITPVDSTVYDELNTVLWMRMPERMTSAVDTIGNATTQSAVELNQLANMSKLEYADACYITLAELPYVITEPGIYRVAEPLILANVLVGGPIIDIQSDDVVLDFCGNTLSLSTFDFFDITVVHVDGFSGIVIKNVIIDSEFIGGNIRIENSDNIIIENCFIKNDDNCIWVTDSDNVVINNCVLNGTDNGVNGIVITDSALITISNCIASNVSNALIAGNVQDLMCTSYYALSGTPFGNGFTIDSLSSRLVFKNCQANSFRGAGFLIAGSFVLLQNCQAFNNETDGFSLNPTAIPGNHIEVISCTASRNNNGIANFGGTDSFVFNCVASNNLNVDYFGVAPVLSAPAVTAATGYWTNISG